MICDAKHIKCILCSQNVTKLYKYLHLHVYKCYYFPDDMDASSTSQVLKVLEHIDDDTEEIGVPLVKTGDVSLAQHFGLYDELPILVYFEDRIPSVFEGEDPRQINSLKPLV